MSWREWGPWIIAAAALLQFWFFLALQRVRGRRGFGFGGGVETYESGSVEVGFDTNGPLLGVAGVLRSPGREIFVRGMELTLVPEKDKTRREFRWIAFKPDFLLPAAGTRSWEMARPFVVSGEGRRFNIVFHDFGAAQEMKPILQGYYHQWRETEGQIRERMIRRGEGSEAAAVAGDLVAEFKHKDICVSSYTELDRKCYWEQGAYSLTLKVVTEDGAGDFTKHFRFNLGKLDAKQLKGNCVAILEEPIYALLGKPAATCLTVQAEYAARESRAGV